MKKTKIYSFICFSKLRQGSGDSVRKRSEIARNYAKRVGGVYQDRSSTDMSISVFNKKERDGLQIMHDKPEYVYLDKGAPFTACS